MSAEAATWGGEAGTPEDELGFGGSDGAVVCVGGRGPRRGGGAQGPHPSSQFRGGSVAELRGDRTYEKGDPPRFLSAWDSTCPCARYF